MYNRRFLVGELLVEESGWFKALSRLQSAEELGSFQFVQSQTKSK